MAERITGIDVAEEPDAGQGMARAPTGITAFVGRTLRGPINRPVLLRGFADFERMFGGLWQPSTLSYAVEQYFENGGGAALVVRLSNGARACTLERLLSSVLEAAPDAFKGTRLDVDTNKPAEAAAAVEEAPKSTVQMSYTATYSSNFTHDVSDEDLKTVLDSYVYWEKGDLKALSAVMGDSLYLNNASGARKTYSNADLMKMWLTSRDSLSSVTIRMSAWEQLKSDKGHKLIMTWYDEIDTYKTGKVDSMIYHDINIVDSVGKIVW